MSNVQNPCDIPLYWLGNRDPYSGWKNNPHITGMYNPLYTANNQGFGHCSGVETPQGLKGKLDHFSIFWDKNTRYLKLPPSLYGKNKDEHIPPTFCCPETGPPGPIVSRNSWEIIEVLPRAKPVTVVSFGFSAVVFRLFLRHFFSLICLRWLEKVKHIFSNGGLMVIGDLSW